jgi:hypothetical protein
MRDWSLITRLGILSAFVAIAAAGWALYRSAFMDPCILSAETYDSAACDPIAPILVSAGVFGTIALVLLFVAYLRRAR